MRKTIFILIIVATLTLVGYPSTRGLAQSLDEFPVVDNANIFGSRINDVETAANSLISQGADVRIRTILSYGSAGSLDQYEKQLEQASPSWLGQNGAIKNNLIVLIISLQERETGLYYGDKWVDMLSDHWQSILDDIMNPLFNDGNFAGGTIRGLAEIGRVIQVVSPTTPGSQTSGQSRWWIVPVVVLAVIGAISGLIVFFYLRKTRANRAAARQKAKLAKQGAASGINELLEAMQMLEIKVSVTADRLTPAEGVALTDRLQKVKGLVDRSSETYANLSHSAGDPENPRLGEAELSAIEGEYKKVLDDLSQSREAAKGLEAEINVVQQAIDGFSAKVAELNSDIEKVLKKQDELKKAGYRTAHLTELITNGRSMVEQAKTMVAEKRILEGTKQIELASNHIKTTIQSAEDLPRQIEEVVKAVDALALRIERVKLTVEKGRDIFERVSTNYADTTWASIQGNGTEAENRINWASDTIDDARSAMEPEQQDFSKASQLAESGNNWLNEAESLINSISMLEVNLIAAQRDAPDEIIAAQNDITKAWDYINLYDEDIRESLEDDLRSAESKNNLAKEELTKERPDYFNICKLSREANESADRILVQARNEHETAERLRIKAASTRRDASARVSITKQYVEDHYQVVKTEARNYLSAAEEALRQSEGTNDTETQISLAAKAETAANQAYSLAQRDVNNSWQNPVSHPGTSGQNIPTIIIPRSPSQPTERPSGGSTHWGSPRGGSGSSSGTIRRGGGSSGWGSRGGGSSGWSSGGGGGRRGGGSRGW